MQSLQNYQHGRSVRLFSKAVAQFYLYANTLLGGPYDIVHCQDWHTALVPMLIGEERKVGAKGKNAGICPRPDRIYDPQSSL